MSNNKVLTIYRRLLKLQKRLPSDLSALGSQFIRDEFKKHKSAEERHLVPFVQEWTQYADLLEQQTRTGGKLGQSLSPAEIDLLTDEQVGQLTALKEEAEKMPSS